MYRIAWKKCQDSFLIIVNTIGQFLLVTRGWLTCMSPVSSGQGNSLAVPQPQKGWLVWSFSYKQMGIGPQHLSATTTTTIQVLGHVNLTPTVAEIEPRHQKGDERGPWTWEDERCPGDGWEPKGVWLRGHRCDPPWWRSKLAGQRLEGPRLAWPEPVSWTPESSVRKESVKLSHESLTKHVSSFTQQRAGR